MVLFMKLKSLRRLKIDYGNNQGVAQSGQSAPFGAGRSQVRILPP